MDDTSQVSQHDSAEIDLFDQTACTVHNGDVSNPDLVLQDEEETGDDVPDQILGAEPDSQPENAGTGKDGGDLDAQFLQDDQNHDYPQADEKGLPDEAGKGVCAFACLLGILARRPGSFHQMGLQFFQKFFQDDGGDPGNEQDQHDMDRSLRYCLKVYRVDNACYVNFHNAPPLSPCLPGLRMIYAYCRGTHCMRA